MKQISIHICDTDKDFDSAQQITNDYVEWLGMDLCFQNIDKEFELFDAMYKAPSGCFLLAKENELILGGVGLRKLSDGICEMKRLYVYNEHQGKGIGKILCDNLISISKELGYSKMRLDTVSKLGKAISLYKKMGFIEILPYYKNPDPTVKYMELDLL